jgi:hypothetical protein
VHALGPKLTHGGHPFQWNPQRCEERSWAGAEVLGFADAGCGAVHASGWEVVALSLGRPQAQQVIRKPEAWDYVAWNGLYMRAERLSGRQCSVGLNSAAGRHAGTCNLHADQLEILT